MKVLHRGRWTVRRAYGHRHDRATDRIFAGCGKKSVVARREDRQIAVTIADDEDAGDGSGRSRWTFPRAAERDRQGCHRAAKQRGHHGADDAVAPRPSRWTR